MERILCVSSVLLPSQKKVESSLSVPVDGSVGRGTDPGAEVEAVTLWSALGAQQEGGHRPGNTEKCVYCTVGEKKIVIFRKASKGSLGNIKKQILFQYFKHKIKNKNGLKTIHIILDAERSPKII
jgi:hypothetical protein